MDGSGDGGGHTIAVPSPLPNANAPPPFLSKTYDMVDDPATDAIVSWSPSNNSFVVWNPPEFGRDLLPKYFKHNNFSSFVRQLNTYGFRKVDPDRWEFANEGFLRGQKHLLKGINRRKPAHVHVNQQSQQPHAQSSSVGACVEVGKFGLEEEVERLKRDKNVLMQELVRLRQQQQSTDNQLQTMVQRLQGMEQRQQQMMSFLAKAVQSPGFLAQFMQQQNDNSRRISDANKKRRLRPDGIAESEGAAVPDGRIVKYQPPLNESAKALLRHFMKVDTSSRLESGNNDTDNFLVGDGSSSSSAIDSGSSSNRVSGVTLQEVPPISGHSSFIPPAAGISGHGTEEVPSISVPPTDVTMTDLSQIPEMIPENVLHTPEGNYTGPDSENGGFVDRVLFGLNESVPFELDNISPDPDIDAMLENFAFWEELGGVHSPLPEEGESTHVNDLTQGSDGKPMENGCDKSQNMDQLTEQMGHLASDTKGV